MHATYRRTLLCILLLSSVCAKAQIIAPDTVICMDTLKSINAVTDEAENVWAFDTTDIGQVPTYYANNTGAISAINNAVYATMVNENGTWYSFVTSYSNHNVIRLDYGNNPFSIPTATNLGTFGSPSGDQEGVQVIKDGTDWYVFVVEGNDLIRINFGTSLSNNSPTSTRYSYPPEFAWPHQLGIKKFGNEWIGFVANRNGNIVRLDFGTSITNAPNATVIPNTGGMSTPSNFALHQQNGRWYMLVTNLINGTLSRLDFGTNLKNNNPTGTHLGDPNNILTLPRTVSIVHDCNQLVAYIINEGGQLFQYDFHNDITSTPSISSLGYLVNGVSNLNAFTPFSYNGVLYFYVIPYAGKTLYFRAIANYPSATNITYYNAQTNPGFNRSGKRDMTLLQDPGGFMGSYAQCKSIYVKPGATKFLNDATICDGDSVTLDATITGATGYQWSNGATTGKITVKTSGKYWVKLTGADSCYVFDDTAEVIIISANTLNLGPDTSICNGDTLTLKHRGGPLNNVNFKWNTGAISSSLQVYTSGTYWLEIENGINCKSSDTIVVNTDLSLDVDLGPDQYICKGDKVTLQNIKTNQGANQYLWSSGNTSSSITVSKAGTYWLEESIGGKCSTRDTVNLIEKPSPTVYLGNDTMLCVGDTLLLNALPQAAGSSFIWNTGDSSTEVKVYETANYWVRVTNLEGCSDADTISVLVSAPPIVDLIDDTTFCYGKVYELYAGIYSGAQYSWSDGSTKDRIYVSEPGSYSVRITNNCGSGYDEVYIDFENCKIWFPSAFSPNGDGLNDIARVLGNIDDITKFKLSIFNRWGERVFYTEDVNQGWDGKFNNVPQSMNTFFYMIQYNFEGEDKLMKGDITLIR